LLAGNFLLLLSIRLLLKHGSSFPEFLGRILPDIAPVVLAGYALTGIIFTGAIDLSIASALALAGTAFGCAVQRGAGPLTAFFLCAGAAWAIMTLNGWLAARLQIPALILTLAGLPFYRGAALILAELAVPNFSGNISILGAAYHTPGRQFAAIVLVVGTLAALLAEAGARHPRLWMALGTSPEACHLMGLTPRKILSSAFLFGGFWFALATLVFVTRVQEIEPARLGLGFELQVIAAVILGGANIFGGAGSYLGALLGTLFLYLITQLLVYAGANAYLQDALTGAIILLIIGADCALHRGANLLEELA
jgi:rhamnose transport system permease protein